MKNDENRPTGNAGLQPGNQAKAWRTQNILPLTFHLLSALLLFDKIDCSTNCFTKGGNQSAFLKP
ncbi:MAG: hypothetical protein ACM3MK_10680 [Chitinophagales bacterium]